MPPQLYTSKWIHTPMIWIVFIDLHSIRYNDEIKMEALFGMKLYTSCTFITCLVDILTKLR